MKGFQQVFAIDVRALAAFRLAAAGLLLADLAGRLPNLMAHYTDAGVLPRAAVRAQADVVPLSLHLLHGDAWFQGVLFALAGLCALALLAGYRTRLATLLCWVMLLSLHVRNPYLVNHGDHILRLLLFWSLFLPLGACASVDALRGRTAAPEGRQVLSVATAAVLLQVCAIYWFSLGYKTGAAWWRDYTAVAYVLYGDVFATPLAHLLRTWPLALHQGLTRATLLVEAVGPVVALLPVWFRPLRMVAVVALAGMHVAFGLVLDIGLFSFVSLTALLLFVPGWFWDALAARLRTAWGRLPGQGAAGAFGRALAGRLRGAGAVVPVPAGPPGPLAAWGVIVLVWYTVLVSAFSLKPAPSDTAGAGIQAALLTPARLVQHHQRWQMFTDPGSGIDGWYVMQGTLADGQVVDVFNEDLPPAWDKPPDIRRRYGDIRWRYLLFKYYRTRSYLPNRPYLAQYLWRRWQHRHPARPLHRLDIYFMHEVTLHTFAESEPVPKLLYSMAAPPLRAGATPPAERP